MITLSRARMLSCSACSLRRSCTLLPPCQPASASSVISSTPPTALNARPFPFPFPAGLLCCLLCCLHTSHLLARCRACRPRPALFPRSSFSAGQGRACCSKMRSSGGLTHADSMTGISMGVHAAGLCTGAGNMPTNSLQYLFYEQAHHGMVYGREAEDDPRCCRLHGSRTSVKC